jgi:hypothetical protein
MRTYSSFYKNCIDDRGVERTRSSEMRTNSSIVYLLYLNAEMLSIARRLFEESGSHFGCVSGCLLEPCAVPSFCHEKWQKWRE